MGDDLGGRARTLDICIPGNPWTARFRGRAEPVRPRSYICDPGGQNGKMEGLRKAVAKPTNPSRKARGYKHSRGAVHVASEEDSRPKWRADVRAKRGDRVSSRNC